MGKVDPRSGDLAPATEPNNSLFVSQSMSVRIRNWFRANRAEYQDLGLRQSDGEPLRRLWSPSEADPLVENALKCGESLVRCSGTMKKDDMP